MRTRALPILLVVSSMSPGLAAAQSADVTFDVPLNLTSIWSEITKVRLACKLDTRAGLAGERFGELELPVTGGQVVTTAHVVIAIPAAAAGSLSGRQNFSCDLTGYSPALGWNPFQSVGGSYTPAPGDRIGPFHVAWQPPPSTATQTYGTRTGLANGQPTTVEGNFTW